jgi:hypothetical protein
LIIEGVATLRELEEWYSIDDVADRNEALDAWKEAESKLSRSKEK